MPGSSGIAPKGVDCGHMNGRPAGCCWWCARMSGRLGGRYTATTVRSRHVIHIDNFNVDVQMQAGSAAGTLRQVAANNEV